MSDLVNTYIQKYREGHFCPEMVCQDGFRMSVQASIGHYCSPRNNEGPYISVEVLLDEGEELFLELDNSHGIYGWVPVKIVEQVIIKHGGLINYYEKKNSL